MKKEKNQKVIRRLTSQFELPKDLVLGDSIVTITGRNDMIVENYKGILEYLPDKIRLSLKHGQIEIYGKQLKIEYYTNDDMRIVGQIDRIEYGM